MFIIVYSCYSRIMCVDATTAKKLAGNGCFCKVFSNVSVFSGGGSGSQG